MSELKPCIIGGYEFAYSSEDLLVWRDTSESYAKWAICDPRLETVLTEYWKIEHRRTPAPEVEALREALKDVAELGNCCVGEDGSWKGRGHRTMSGHHSACKVAPLLTAHPAAPSAPSDPVCVCRCPLSKHHHGYCDGCLVMEAWHEFSEVPSAPSVEPCEDHDSRKNCTDDCPPAPAKEPCGLCHGSGMNYCDHETNEGLKECGCPMFCPKCAQAKEGEKPCK